VACSVPDQSQSGADGKKRRGPDEAEGSELSGKPAQKRRSGIVGKHGFQAYETETGLHASCCRYMLHLVLAESPGIVTVENDDKPYVMGEQIIVPFHMKNILRFTSAIMKERERHTGSLHVKDHANAMVYGISAIRKKASLNHLLHDFGEFAMRPHALCVPYDGRKLPKKAGTPEGQDIRTSQEFSREREPAYGQDNVERKAWEAFKEFIKRCNARPGNPGDKYVDYLTSQRWHVRIEKRSYGDIIPLLLASKHGLSGLVSPCPRALAASCSACPLLSNCD
jgi:hypothetical protein